MPVNVEYAVVEKVSDAVVVEEGDKNDRDLSEVIPTAGASDNGLREKFCALQTRCWAVHTEVN